MRKDRFFPITMLVVVMLLSSMVLAGPSPVMGQTASELVTFSQIEDGAQFEFTYVMEFQACNNRFNDTEYTGDESQRWQTNHAGYRTETAIKQRQQRVSRAEM